MKDICIVGYNYGNKYEGFIPIFIYSVLRSYPEYDVVVFSDSKLSDETKKNLERLKGLGSFEVVENYGFGLEQDQKVLPLPGLQMAMRWFFYDNCFQEYRSIYIGDIDMFICKENIGIYEQHLKHCEQLNLPYSNYIRITSKVETPNIKLILKNLFKVDLKTLLNMFKKREVYFERFTGLHFVKTNEYYPRVSKHFSEFISLITKEAPIVDPNLYYRSEYNEVLLYRLINKSGIGLPPISPDSPGIDYKNPTNISFRPHHGIHMGIFRGKSVILNQQQVLKSYVYNDYILQYSSLIKNDEILKTLLLESPKFIREQFILMEKFYGIKGISKVENGE